MTADVRGCRWDGMTNVIISGPFGRMGRALCRLAEESETITLAGGLVAAGKGMSGGDLRTFERLPEVPRESRPCVLIDFTQPDATMERLREAAAEKIPVVIGTTGFSAEQLEEIRRVSAEIPVLVSANMSLGINLLLGVVEDLAARLAGYDIEVIETHHRLKKDAPSGTALALANAAAAGRGVDLDEVAKHGRSGFTGERTGAEIGIHAVRGGDVVGDHTVLFAGMGERVEVSHKASSRDTFAAGALFAAEFLGSQGAGLYSMKDALGV